VLIQRIITAVVLIPLVLLLILRAPIAVLAVVAGIVALLAIREFLALTRHYGVEPFTTATYAAVGAFFAILTVIVARGNFFNLNALVIGVFVWLSAGIAPFVFLATGLRRGNLNSIYPAAAASVFAYTYIAIPMALLVVVCEAKMGGFHLIYLLLVVWAGDIFAYFVGKSIGRHQMSPRISPKKTWEGAVASVIASVGIGTFFYQYALPVSQWLLKVRVLKPGAELWDLRDIALWKVVLLSIVLNIAAQLGDLVESAIKRGADVKDSGSILPGHGGMLDRIDAMLFAAPMLCLIVLVAGYVD
jgi:phosphatidate cytidylyltransferase